MSPHPLARVTPATVLVWLFVVATQLVNGLYFASASDPPDAYVFLSALAFLWVFGCWVIQDSRARGIAWPLDMGLFIYIAWHFVMPYYLFKTRGATKGLLIIGAFGIVSLLALVVGRALGALLPGPQDV